MPDEIPVDPVPAEPTAPALPDPVFPEILATEPTVVAPVQGATYDKWFLVGCNITSNGGKYDLESFWTKGNATELSNITKNAILRDIKSTSSLAEQLTVEWLKTNADAVGIMPVFLDVLARIAKQQGVL